MKKYAAFLGIYDEQAAQFVTGAIDFEVTPRFPAESPEAAKLTALQILAERIGYKLVPREVPPFGYVPERGDEKA